jgi:hypothetical protein
VGGGGGGWCRQAAHTCKSALTGGKATEGVRGWAALAGCVCVTVFVCAIGVGWVDG